ncbi:MAG: helix-turn-helix domain-containing protein [Clostridiales bacterium]|nr:helix-turn-helix domain-containing protein [Clostridiales bacterium]
MTVGQRIKSLREEQSLTQGQFAAALGLSKSAIGMYEIGQREPNLETLHAIADYFQVDMAYLLGTQEVRNVDELLRQVEGTLRISDADPQLTALMDSAAQLNAQGKQKLVEYAGDLVLSGRYRQKGKTP